MKLVVNGIGILSALGTVDTIVELLQQPQIMATALPTIAKIQPTFPPELNIPAGLVRRMSHFAKLAVLSASYAVADAAIDFSGKRVGIIQGSVFGPIASGLKAFDELIDFGDDKLSPTTFSGSVFNAAATYLSLAFGIRGPALTVTAGADTLYNSLLTAELWLESNTVDYVVLGIGDELAEYFMASDKASSSTTAKVPTAEGWTTLILSRSGEAGLYGELEFGRSEKLAISDDNQVYSSPIATKFENWSLLRGNYPSGAAFDVALMLLARKLQRIPHLATDKSGFSISDLVDEGITCFSSDDSGKVAYYYRAVAKK